MKKALRYTLAVLVVLAAVLTGAGYYMVDYALKPEGLVTRSRDIPGSLEYMHRTYPEVGRWIDSLQHVQALRDLYIETRKERSSTRSMFLPPIPPTERLSSYTAIRIMPSAC